MVCSGWDRGREVGFRESEWYVLDEREGGREVGSREGEWYVLDEREGGREVGSREGEWYVLDETEEEMWVLGRVNGMCWNGWEGGKEYGCWKGYGWDGRLDDFCWRVLEIRKVAAWGLCRGREFGKCWDVCGRAGLVLDEGCVVVLGEGCVVELVRCWMRVVW